MKVALFFFSICSAGGAERMLCWLANSMSRKGVTVVLLTLDSPGAQSFYSLSEKIVWEQLGQKKKIQRTFQLVDVLKRHKVSVLIGFVISGDRTIYSAAKLAKTKLIVAERNAPTMYRIRFSIIQRWMCFLLMHLADRISIQNNSFILGYPSTLRNRMVTIPNPVRPAKLFAKPDVPNIDGRYEILYVGRLDSTQKGISYLLNAFASLAEKYPSWDLRLVGSGPQKAELTSLVDLLGLNERIHFIEEVKQLSEIYSSAHLFVIPSLWEGFPNSLAEALSHGVPAVGYRDAAGVAELIPKDVGWLAKGNSNAASLAKSLEVAIQNREERKIRGQKAIEFTKLFEPELQVERWVALLNEL